MEKLFDMQNIQVLLDSIRDGVQVIDSEGRLVYCNRRAAMLDDINIEASLGKSLLEIYPSLTDQTSTMLRVLRTGFSMMDMEQTFTTYRGKKVTTLNSTYPLKDGRKIIGAVEVSSNITEVKALSERVVDLQSQVLGEKPAVKADMAKYTFEDIITDDIHLMQTKSLAMKVAQIDAPLMVCGDTGTGKELLVQSIHNASHRRSKPFIAQNCAAIPGTLLEGILFGTKKGGFTGSVDRPGLFELAEGGTLFLDEINSMPMDLQAKLLRVLQEGTLRRIGDTKSKVVNVRVIAATNLDPEEAVTQSQLRRDLYYRLNTVQLVLPPLKDRKVDIPVLANHFVHKCNEKLYRHVTHIHKEVMERFMEYDWPGNVRELEHAIEGAMAVLDGTEIRLEDLPPKFQLLSPTSMARGAGSGSLIEDGSTANETGDAGVEPLMETLSRLEEDLIQKAFEACGGNVSKTAKQLKVPRQTLQYKLKKFGLS